MPPQDLDRLSDALGIQPSALVAAFSALRAIVREEVREEVREAHRLEGIDEETIYTVADLEERLPWSRATIDKMVTRRQIPMVKVEGRWIITAAAFRAAAAAGFPIPAGRVRTRRAA
ncbi:hypothetical protein B1759_15125 [Rubrivirga sp. SAORIC476]|uniref:hypothetical protein n=1 Tax=Rubrivirga sp. SAORIC476 TaxID=1961794 RepID=UPI000BA96C1B|nr:hypothetical protein [Rubrivirga sp. SAORIC476]PAP79649.1 hypothetical protein B1759_15125 [Rubrivirga sp. SAORIC476]